MATEQRSKTFALTPVQRRMLDTTLAIKDTLPDHTDFLHSAMCQVGMPRSRTTAREFERRNGNTSIKLEAGQLYNGRDWVEQPLPYGPCPRLVMVHISSEAIKTKSRVIDIGNSMHQFLQTLGIATGGGPRGGYTTFKKQMQALAAARLMIGYVDDGRAITMESKLVRRFEAWLQLDETQVSMWPGELELTQDFYDSLSEHAVPLDPRALAALKHSALALDIYVWLAHRLCRVRKAGGVRLSWSNLVEQFGQEYANVVDFKKEFQKVLPTVLLAYPSARVEKVRGGYILHPSPPPLPKTQVVVALPSGN